MISKAFLVLVGGLAGCAPQASSADGVTAAALSTDPGEAFLGTWTFAAGSQATIACPGAPAVVQSLAESELVLSVGDDGLVQAVNGVGCHYRYAVEGSAASLVPGQTCEVPDGQGGTTTERLEHDLITLAGVDGLKVDAGGTLGPDGACALTVTGTLTR